MAAVLAPFTFVFLIFLGRHQCYSGTLQHFLNENLGKLGRVLDFLVQDPAMMVLVAAGANDGALRVLVSVLLLFSFRCLFFPSLSPLPFPSPFLLSPPVSCPKVLFLLFPLSLL